MAMRTGRRLPGWAAQALEELDRSDAQAVAVTRDLTAAELNWRTAPEQWSVGQCLHHLWITNNVYLAAIARALPSRPSVPVEQVTPGWFGRWFIRNYIDPSTQSRPHRAPRKIAPPPDVDPAIVDRFVQSNVGARDLVQRASAYDVNRLRFQNPFVPLIRFTVGTGIEIVWRHQRRHLLQAERTRDALRRLERL